MAYINFERFDSYMTNVTTDVTKVLHEQLQTYVDKSRVEMSGVKLPLLRKTLLSSHELDRLFVAERGKSGYLPPKRIRPAILMMTAEGNDYHNREKLIYAATSPELLHNSSLVFDDIQDRDKTRSGEPTVRERWRLELKHDDYQKVDALTIDNGIKLMMMPSLILSQAKFRDELRNEVVYTLQKAAIELSEGQTLDLILERKLRVPFKDILFMYEKKTGALFEACALIGIILSRENPNSLYSEKQRELLSLWARKYFNWRFQIHDDFIENNIDGKKGKEKGKDIVRGKMTPLIRYALDHGSSEERKILLEALGNPNATDGQINGAIGVVHSTGAVGRLRKLKEEYGEKGKALIEECGFLSEFEENLKDLTEYVGVRTH